MEEIIKEVVKKVLQETKSSYSVGVPIGISNRHIHLSIEDLNQLFGHGYELTKLKDLKQPGEFACEETLTIKVNEREISRVRILGPVRPQTQVEISMTDARFLKVNPPVRNSGDLDNSTPITLIGPKGTVNLNDGLILATRHLHLTTSDAERIGVTNNEQVSVRVRGCKSGILNNVYCKVKDTYAFELHLDTDDGNAFLINNGDIAEIIKGGK